MSAAANTPIGNIKATKADWINAARRKLETVAIDQLKILSLSRDLDVSRSSFYWYFDGLDELQSELVEIWTHSTAAIVERARRPAENITAACLGVFECWSDESLFDPRLEFAIRDWGRRDNTIADQVYLADLERLHALAAMFRSHGIDEMDAMVRARLLYHSQIGYYAVGTDEPTELRLMFLPSYLHALTDVEPTSDELREFAEYFTSLRESTLDQIHTPGENL